jgi:hypothetical protein
MIDMKLDSDGDLVFDNLGFFQMVYDRDEMIQSVLLRLDTIQGELFYNTNYGMPLDIKQLKLSNESIPQINSIIQGVLLQDSRIQSVKVIRLTRDQYTGLAIIDLSIGLTDATVIELSYNLEVA